MGEGMGKVLCVGGCGGVKLWACTCEGRWLSVDRASVCVCVWISLCIMCLFVSVLILYLKIR